MKFLEQPKALLNRRLGTLGAIMLMGFSLIIISSCSHEGDVSQLDPVSYTASIAPIMTGNCSMTGCHDGGEEFSLNGYSNVMAFVTPGDSKGSELYTVLSTSLERMPPQPANPLTKQQRTLIDVWILQGAKNN